MQNKKTIILGLIAIILLVGVVWYANKNKEEITNQTASILGIDGENKKVTELDGDFIFGDPLAPVTIIEYSSHLCGACSNFHKTTLPLIVENYVKTGKVRIIPRLVSHPALSIAVLCAQEQGAFWELNNYIFENIETIQAVDDITSAVGLDQESFDQCYLEKYVNQVMKWLDEGEKPKDCDTNWIPSCQVIKWFEQAEEDEADSTPTFLINGQKIVGSQPYAIFEDAIKSQLNN